MNTLDPVRYCDACYSDGPALAAMARQSFRDTFADTFPAVALNEHLDAAYGSAGLIADLSDPLIAFRIAKAGDKIIGYAKLRPLSAPAPKPASGALELQQIYVLQSWHGSGVADTLCRWAIREARTQGASELYLTVFDHNERAKRFYARHGFSDIGQCWFTLGDCRYEDRIWRKAL